MKELRKARRAGGGDAAGRKKKTRNSVWNSKYDPQVAA